MRRGAVRSFLGALSLAGLVVVGTPASAGTTGPISCGNDAWVSGATEVDGQLTFLTGSGFGHCGQLGVRVHYSHVGGYSWTGWTYSDWAGGNVTQNVGSTAIESQHTTSVGDLNFRSYK